MIDQILNSARACLETPFRHQGRVAGVGMDCAGLAVHIVEDLGLPYKDMYGYSRVPHEGKLKAMLDLQPSLQQVSTPEPGDLLLMKFGGEPTHIAVFTGSTVIHAYEAAGKVCEHILDSDWKAWIVASYRIRSDS